MNRSLLRLSSVALLLCCALPVFAQMTNAGFETWTSGNPDGWLTTNAPPAYTTITQVSAAHSGSSALRGDVVQFFGTAIAPILISGNDGVGFPFTQRPGAFTGYYEFFPAAGSGDRFSVDVVTFRRGLEGTPIAVGAAALSASVSSYAQFSAPFNYVSAETPDSCVVTITIIGPGTGSSAQPHPGSYFVVDDLAFGQGGATAVRDLINPFTFQLDQNYPNPFNPSTRISYTVAQSGHVTLKLFNMLGQEVSTLVNEEKSAGRYSLSWNGANLPSGVYLYQLTVSSAKGELFNGTRRMVLLK